MVTQQLPSTEPIPEPQTRAEILDEAITEIADLVLSTDVDAIRDLWGESDFTKEAYAQLAEILDKVMDRTQTPLVRIDRLLRDECLFGPWVFLRCWPHGDSDEYDQRVLREIQELVQRALGE